MKKVILLSFVFLCFTGELLALPFNDDMVDSQLKTGQVMRPKPEGAVPIGSLDVIQESWDETAAKKNPVKSSPESVQRGKRLYNVNCLPCHGEPKMEGHEYGKVGKKIGVFMKNVADPMYHDVSDGFIYSTIRNGSRSKFMPAIGWKISPEETWDIVNYVRSTQKK